MAKDVPKVKYHADPDQKEIKAKWWMQPATEMHTHVFGVVREMRQKQAFRSLNHLRYARLYGNKEMIGLQAGLFAHVGDPSAFVNSRLALNIIEACVDTAASKIGKNKTRPLFMTEGGKWSEQRKAEKLTKFMEAAFDCMGTGTGDNRTLYGVGRRAFVDAAALGTGVVKFFPDKAAGMVKAERCLIEEIVVDETEGMYESPRQMHQEKFVSREVLCDLFTKPKDREMIEAAGTGMDANAAALTSADLIKVIESWHLPSGKDAKDGRKCISIENHTLDVSDWKKDYFPFLFKRWKTALLGFHGVGMGEQLMGIQLEINKKVRAAALADHLCGSPQVWLEMQNKVNAKHQTNEIGGINYFIGSPPIFNNGIGMRPEFYQSIENLWQKGFNLIGISEMSATSRKAPGLDAAVAMRESQDIESERFAMVQQRDQDFYIEAAYLVADMMDELDNPKISIAEGDSLEEIAWKSVKLDISKCRIRSFPTDILPSQPAAKLNKVQELTQAGYFDKEESMELLDFPDLKRVSSLKLSSRRNLCRILEKIIETGKYITPEPYGNLQKGRFLAQAYYEQGQCQNMPEEILDLLRRYMDDCQALIEKSKQTTGGAAVDANAQMQAAAGDAGADSTMGQPAPQPVSALLPVA